MEFKPRPNELITTDSSESLIWSLHFSDLTVWRIANLHTNPGISWKVWCDSSSSGAFNHLTEPPIESSCGGSVGALLLSLEDTFSKANGSIESGILGSDISNWIIAMGVDIGNGCWIDDGTWEDVWFQSKGCVVVDASLPPVPDVSFLCVCHRFC